jgi:hypothetical protein
MEYIRKIAKLVGNLVIDFKLGQNVIVSTDIMTMERNMFVGNVITVVANAQIMILIIVYLVCQIPIELSLLKELVTVTTTILMITKSQCVKVHI